MLEIDPMVCPTTTTTTGPNSLSYYYYYYYYFVLHCMCLLCQCWLHVLPLSRISVFMHLLDRSTTSQYRRNFVLHSISLQNDRVDKVCHGVGLEDFKSRGSMPLCWPKMLAPILSSTVFSSLIFSMGWLCGVSVFALLLSSH